MDVDVAEGIVFEEEGVVEGDGLRPVCRVEGDEELRHCVWDWNLGVIERSLEMS